MTKIVRKKLSSSSITEARKRRLAKFAARPDSTIDSRNSRGNSGAMLSATPTGP